MSRAKVVIVSKFLDAVSYEILGSQWPKMTPIFAPVSPRNYVWSSWNVFYRCLTLCGVCIFWFPYISCSSNKKVKILDAPLKDDCYFTRANLQKLRRIARAIFFETKMFWLIFFVVKRNYFILDISIVYLASAASTLDYSFFI